MDVQDDIQIEGFQEDAFEAQSKAVSDEKNKNTAEDTSPEPETDPLFVGKENADAGDACVLEKLEEISAQLAALQECYDEKIAVDTHKNKLFDNMHSELVRYQNGVLDKVVESIALDIIQMADSTKSTARIYEKKEPTEENYQRLLRMVKGIAEDLDDILYRQNIESYHIPGHVVDPRKQRIIQTIETQDPSQDNKVAFRVADGYEKEGKVIRPERIKIYKYTSEEKS